MLVNKTKQIKYKELKPGDIIVCGDVLKNPSFDCLVLSVDYNNEWLLALTRNFQVKQYPLFLGTLYVIDKDDL